MINRSLKSNMHQKINPLKTSLHKKSKYTRKKAQGFYTQSIIMLSIGLSVGVSGIAIFVWIFPRTIDSGDIVRTTGIFLFIEAIAWFFFRQYVELRRHHEKFYREFII